MAVSGVWMWPQSVRLRGAKAVVSRCARAGITDIYFLTKGLAGTSSFPGKQVPCNEERDLLSELLAAAHAKDIRVHAWLTSASDEHYKRLHPESGRCHFTRGRDKGLISLTDEGYLRYMECYVRELCRSHDIDGLHLDYVRYNHLLYGWGEADVARCAAAGADPAHLRRLMEETFCRGEKSNPDCIFDALRAKDPHVLALSNTRRADVVHFASALTSAAREEKPALLLSAALMPEGAYDDTTFADLHYGQNYEDAAALYDHVLPMAYSKAYEQEARWVKAVAEGTMKRGLKTIVGLHAYDGGTGPSLQADLAALSQTHAEGVCLFREGAFALAFPDGRRVTLVNALDQPITAIHPGPGEALVTLERAILPGEERSIALACAPDALRIFTGNSEACVYTPRNI
ncbi:MAG: hypothetical protein IKJ11_08150 [Clostridia bacterium]|nr:hypothetical protein [Clostridia bacterium]